jgi:CPA1 family monovalent cation:H+ antiporter
MAESKSGVPEGWRRIEKSECPHIATLAVEARSDGARCEACGLTADLRVCLTCGYVGCCESHDAHDTQHFRETGHPFIRPQGGGGGWLWCYECNAFLQ